MNELKILAVDTATEACSAALLVGDKLFSRWEEAPRDHTRKILPMVQAVLDDADDSLHITFNKTVSRTAGIFTLTGSISGEIATAYGHGNNTNTLVYTLNQL